MDREFTNSDLGLFRVQQSGTSRLFPLQWTNHQVFNMESGCVKVIYSPEQLYHQPPHELHQGKLVPYFESAKRAETILAAIQIQQLGEVIEPPTASRETIERVHSPDYVEFMATVYQEWQVEQSDNDPSLFPHVWRMPGMSDIVPNNLFGKLGYYSFDAGTPITQHSWISAVASASTAVHAADLVVENREPVFALCRPPGHHAGGNYFGGYCFLNSAAIAAQRIVDQTKTKVAILDVDYHHGNGTQAIFYDRSDVFFASIHADPLFAYPYFSGHSDERGEKDGLGFNLNIPLPFGTLWAEYKVNLRQAIRQIENFGPEYLIVSLGVDTFENDPISGFRLKAADFEDLGREIAKIKTPTMFAMEGGYDIGEIGQNVVNTLKSYEQG